MKHKIFAIWGAFLLAAEVASFAAEKPACYELRTYTAHEGKLEALHNRFRNHTTKLFAKHGMVNIGYWTPQENAKHQLIYLLGYPNRQARDRAWKKFFEDPDWKKAYRESIVNGRLVKKVETLFLAPTDYSPPIRPAAASPEERAFERLSILNIASLNFSAVASPARVFELRIYTAAKGKLDNLHARFRDHTLALFAKHGITNFAYFKLTAGQPNSESALLYFLAHKSRQAAKDSFVSFLKDPKWIAAKKASEENAGGSLTVRNGVRSLFLNPTDYSPTR